MHARRADPEPAVAPQATAPRPAQAPGRRWIAAVTLVSLLACGSLTLVSPSPFGDLSSLYTDHMRHATVTWIFLHRGLDVYRLPLAEAAQGTTFRYPHLSWPELPYAYPPLALALFLPYSLAVQYLPLSPPALARLGILYLLAIAHLALYAILRDLDRLTPVNLAFAAIAWLLLARAGLQGFYDPAWIACGAVMVTRLRHGRPQSALVWFALSFLLSYRAVALAPLGLAAALDSVRGKPWRTWPWGRLLAVAAAGLACVTLFRFVVPHSAGFRPWPTLLEQRDTSFRYVVGATLVAVPVAAFMADFAVAGAVLVCGGLAVVDTLQWWHGLVLLVAPMATGAWRPARMPALGRAALLAWMLVLHRHAWGGPPSQLLPEIKDCLRQRRAGAG